MRRPVTLHWYRGHQENCPHRDEGRSYKNCSCPIWLDGTNEKGERVMCSMRTRNRLVAEAMIREMEARGSIEPTMPPELEDAFQKFIAAKTGRVGLERIKQYRRMFLRLLEFLSGRKIGCLSDLNLELLTDFLTMSSNRWSQRAGTIGNTIRMLRTFFAFCQKMQWVQQNVAKGLEMPRSGRRPTLPFSPQEWQRILEAFPLYAQRTGQLSARRLLAFVLLLRYSGIRIGDATRFEITWINDDRISFETQKRHIYIRNKLPGEVLEILRTIPVKNGRYFFWTGQSSLHSAVGKWQRRLKILFTLAGVRNGHAHRFRDSYAFDMTHNGGMTLEELKQALGHKSTRTTEKYYSHWLEERQARLEHKQSRAWAVDPALSALGGKEEQL
jgi:integrase/recombinase XerD